jgi:hypothetical protein
MSNKMLEIKYFSNRLQRWLLSAALLGMLLFNGFAPAVNAAPGPPRGRPPLASAGLGFRDMDKMFSPAVGTPGEEITYTFHVVCDPVASDWGARQAYIEMPMYGTQKYVRFNPNNTGWKLREPFLNNTVHIDIGSLDPHQEGTVQLVLTVPTDLNRTIMEQGLYLQWDDEGGHHDKGHSILLPLNVPMPGPVELPPAPSGQPNRNQPTSGPFAPQSPPGPLQYNTLDHWFIAATSHNLSGDFLTYWLEHGAVNTFGYPISELFQEPGSGIILQYFERAVMEYHPENDDPYRVLLKSMGRELDKATPGASADTAPNLTPGSVYFADTGHWLDGRFVDYWQNNGGLAQFGFPISEAVVDGNRLVQWTERARLEVDISSRFKPLVQLGLVGVELARVRGYLPQPQ